MAFTSDLLIRGEAGHADRGHVRASGDDSLTAAVDRLHDLDRVLTGPLDTSLRSRTRWLASLSVRLNLLALVIAVLCVLAIAWRYLPFVADDALISFRYSQRLLAGRGLTFTDGEFVEGYSNLLWILTVAAGGLRFTRDLILVGRVVGVLCTVFTLAAVLRARPISSTETVASAFAVCAGLATLALSHGLAIWSIGGLEQALQAALLAWVLALIAFPRPGLDERIPAVVPGLLLGLLVLTRPDGALFCALVAAGLLALHGLSLRTLRNVWSVAWLPAIAWLGQETFRLWYYRDWLPNTAYVKLSGSTHHLIEGLAYLKEAVVPHAPILLLAAAGLAFARPFRRRDVLIPLVIAVGWSAYVVFVGGDIFPGRRHFLPVLVCLAFLIVATWRHSIGRLPTIVQAGVLVASFAAYVGLQRADVANDRARTEGWEWACGQLASELGSAFRAQQPLMAAEAIGCSGYFSELPMLDLLGLNDRHLAHNRPADFGEGYVGHELGDGRYVLERGPDILLFGEVGGQSAWFRSGIELQKLPEFAQQYTLIAMRPFGWLPRAPVWFRWTSPRIGVTRSANEIRIPGYLFAAPNQATARLLHGRELVTHLPAANVVTFNRLNLGPGPWIGRAIGSAPAEVSVEGSTIRVTAGSADTDLSAVILTR